MKFRYLLTGTLLSGAVLLSGISTYAATVETAGVAAEGITIESTEASSDQAPAAAENTPHIEVDENAKIPDGVYAGSISLGGLTVAQAREAINDYYKNISSSTFTVDTNGKKILTTLDELGFTYDAGTIVEEACTIGQYGGLISRYKTLMDLRYDKVVVPVTHSVDTALVTEFVKDKVAVADTPAVDATITRDDNGDFVVTPHTTGLATNQEATVQTILDAVNNQLAANMEVKATVEVTEPTCTTEMLEAIDTRLGTYSTSYSSSAAGRKTNIAVAAGYLDGTVLLPGQSLSVSETIKPREPEYGYAIGGEYLNGETIESYGGGVCQVSTTLYNALLQAELEIDTRYPHSMLVSYVEPSFDAAIATGSKDLVFTNNTGNPVYIASSADGATLTFSIYGKEYRPSNRTIEYESVVVSRTTSTPKEVEDPTQPTGYRDVKGSNHDACTSYLQKNIYIDGKLSETVRFDTDYYQASQQTITIGTGAATTTTAAADTTAAASSTESTTAPTEAPTEAPTTAAPEETLPEGVDPPEDDE